MNVKPGRNDPCPCGSGKKFKKCCHDQFEARPSAANVAARQLAPSPAECNQLIALFNAGRHEELERCAGLLLGQYPYAGFVWKIFGASRLLLGGDALPALQKATEFLPDDVDAHYYLGNVYLARRRHDDAATSYRRALGLKPDFTDAHYNLGVALEGSGRLDSAIASYRRALAIKADYAEAYFNLGNALRDTGQLQDAAASYRSALTVKPDFIAACSNLANVLRNLGQLDAALEGYRRVLEINPDLAEGYNNLGSALKDAGRLDEAIACYRRAVELDPKHTQAHSNLVYTLCFHPAFDEQGILTEAKQFAALHPHIPQVHAQAVHAHASKLRIGYVSPDFRTHCQSLFTVPLLSNHDHTQFEIYCYAHLPGPDEISERLAGYADVWQFTHDKSDAQLAEMIAGDGIDILVDLTMHMNQGRPMLFARKPAPVQVAWLAYPGTTGLAEMDYRFTDPWLDPVEMDDARYTEASVRLPDSFWCYDPLVTGLQPNDLPALTAGYITFGCLNNFCKVSDDTLSRWGQVMKRLPSSRLILLAYAGGHRQRILDLLGDYDVAAERIEFVEYRPRLDYLQTYHRIDICLDTLPYNGHTTSLDACWMGVPVVTQVGNTIVGRAGWSQLNNLGLSHLAAFDEQAFIDIAVALANDLKGLSHLRQTLRGRMEASPLMDGKRFAGAIESAYRQIRQSHTQA
jgi:predicted O-linked N-acetylglucosamine transferase (SPINDLY family)